MTIQDQVAAIYDDFSEDLAILGDKLEGWPQARDCREFAYVAWRAARAEHLNPVPAGLPKSEHELRPCACLACQSYAVFPDKGMPALESFVGIGR